MGDFKVKPIASKEEKLKYYNAMMRDIEALEIMLSRGMIDEHSNNIGAEQEVCLIDQKGNPHPTAHHILSQIEDPGFTNEIALYNLEINFDPERLEGDCFSKIERKLKQYISKGNRIGQALGSNILLTGILPTLKYRYLQSEYMTPELRYQLLSDELLKRRGRDFEIYLQGVDDINTNLGSVLFEACNTSFQLHLQINPNEFIEKYNWAQLIAGPVLSVCANSPLLFGKELWAENRIALFKQSLDTRGTKNHYRDKMPRVYFGKEWLTTSPIDLWKKELIRFQSILMSEEMVDAIEILERGCIPRLGNIRLHTGSTYTWNRMCYGVNNEVPHLRIECRYLPAGPTIVDEIANFAFWVGLMKGMPEEMDKFWSKIDFRSAKSNFIQAARTGINTIFDWNGEKISAQDLLLNKLIGYAENGLRKHKVNENEVEYYLGIIRERAKKKTNGADWVIRNFRKLLKDHKSSVACNFITLEMLDYQVLNLPVHKWEEVKSGYPKAEILAEDIMQSDIITVQQDMPISYAEFVMEWKKFHHLPVEDEQGHLVGLISATQIGLNIDRNEPIYSIMVKNIITCGPIASLEKVKQLLNENSINSLLVVEQSKLIGILTSNDIPVEPVLS